MNYFLSRMKGVNFLILAIALVSVLVPEMAMAQNSQTQALTALVQDGQVFKLAIDLGLIIFALYQWFLYISNFDPGSAFKNIILPALITFLAFQWVQVLGWINLV